MGYPSSKTEVVKAPEPITQCKTTTQCKLPPPNAGRTADATEAMAKPVNAWPVEPGTSQRLTSPSRACAGCCAGRGC